MSKYSTTLSVQNTHKQSLAFVRNGLIGLALLAFVIQLLVDVSVENVLSNLLALSTTVICAVIVFQRANATSGKSFIATIVFLMIISNSLLPVLGTLMEGNSLIVNLLEPVQTYFHRLLFALVLSGALIVSDSNLLFSLKYGLSKVGSVLGANLHASAGTVWGFGIIATCGTFISYLPIPVSLGKFLAGFQFLMYAPFILVVAPYNANIKGWQKKILFFYYLLIAGISLANNSRSGMVAPIAVTAAAWIMSVLLGQIVVNKNMIRKFVVVFIGAFFLLAQFIDVSTAILLARAGREDRTSSEQLAYTWVFFLDKEALYEYRMTDLEIVELQGDGKEDWQENYIANPFLARFILIKFDDNCLYRVNQFDDAQKQVLMLNSFERNLVQLPTPLLDLLDINVDKKEINSYSMGDLIHNLATGHTLGSFVVGSIPVHAFAILGWFYPFILFIIYTLIFILFSGVVSVLNSQRNDLQKYSTLGLILPFYLFTIISVDGLYIPINILIRGIWQILLIYWIAILLLRMVGILGFQRTK